MHPCLTCGACCTQYRVAFHWMESEAFAAEGVPDALTEALDPHRLCMRGTRAAPSRCAALDAEIGRRSRCTIHPRRPSVCREVEASWEYGRPSPQCDKARLAHGLPLLAASDWPWRGETGSDAPPDDGGHAPPRLPPLAA